jgi:iron(III) transport system ATP-binding protein
VDSDAVAAIRPVDIIPHGSGARSPGAPDAVGTPENLIDAHVEAMEFLGGFWRVRLAAVRLGARILIADFSINAVRRLGIATGSAMQVELPPERLLVFAKED